MEDKAHDSFRHPGAAVEWSKKREQDIDPQISQMDAD